MLDLSSPLDVTTWKQKGQELYDAIDKEIKGLNETMLFGIPLPSKIVMTQAQYDDQERLKTGMVNSTYTEGRLYQTPYNIMEVRVENPKLTFKEAMSLDDKAFNEWEKSND